MNVLLVLLVAAATFALCYGLDKGYTKIFRGSAQHQSGLSVRLSKRYGSVGLVIAVIGLAALFTGMPEDTLLIVCGVVLMILGICLVVYYMTFGIFYDYDSFILTTFGKKSTVYHYRDIKSQQLYNSYGNIIIELHMTDGRAVQLQSGMEGVYPFLDSAFAGWMQQKGLAEDQCPFHDPQNSCWFPPLED